ncbi:hypothetical protein DOK67_0000594 [Enterococcus sp. DIV0212c]|uniref:LPXTG cell wall anchor domain-containing protein n=1 Tax=Enterococcus sp. DIV0212c TaxID=2230867 RepID=UPI001A9BD56F|nr:LPXTG cell wall anchor domain-containing protein [Enterococcus sp. DIV0212c]MBO1354580.1 LPXTG cell wall anchor domain-containing protein [Enterococcus sp. DIV0212c]
MIKKITYLGLLLMFVGLFANTSTKVYAEDASNAKSRVGIRFVDRREHKETNQSTTGNNQLADGNLPSTNEESTVYLIVIGIIIVLLVSVIGYWELKKRSKNNHL